LATALGSIAEGRFSGGDTGVFADLVSNLTDHDPFLVLADYADYIRSQDEVSRTWQDTEAWTRKSILNSARSGKFSSDRSIAEYCDEIWNVGPVTIAD
jgi:starch phosphorylase